MLCGSLADLDALYRRGSQMTVLTRSTARSAFQVLPSASTGSPFTVPSMLHGCALVLIGAFITHGSFQLSGALNSHDSLGSVGAP
jgi:hypothetical protein